MTALGNALTALNGVLGNGTGILIDNSPDNVIGGTGGSSTRNIISGNGQYGIEITQVRSAGNQVEGNYIGTNIAGTGFPGGSSEGSPAQDLGVFVDGVSGVTIGGTSSGESNVISGNDIGVEIANLKLNGATIRSGDFVEGNLIGTNASGTGPVSNLDLGVFIDNAQGNVIGPGNDIAANGIAGVEIFAQDSIGNLVTGNTIGENINGQIFSSKGAVKLTSTSPESGITVYAGAQLNGVVVLGASQNIIGKDKTFGSVANAISGNVQVGVYITSRDYTGLTYSVPANNAVSGNIIAFNGDYGVLLYDAPYNPVPPYDSHNKALVANKYKRDPTSFRNYQGGGGKSHSAKSSKSGGHAKAIERIRKMPGTRCRCAPECPSYSSPKKPHEIKVVTHPHGKV